ncbi:MAG: T9SS type A sorting domain-containing protein [Bacteroidota bacterium]
MIRTLKLLILFVFSLQTAQAQWTNIPIAEETYPLNFDTDGDDVYVLTIGGVYKSTDRGDHWNLVEGSRFIRTCGMQIQVENGVIYVLGCFGELFKTEDQGAHWLTILAKPYLNPAPDEQLSRIFVTGNTVLVGSKHTIYRSVDRGAHWASTVDWPSLSTYEGFAQAGTDLFAIVDKSVLKSADGGATWKQNYLDVSELSALFSLDNVLFIKIANAARMLRSFDRGIHWEVLDANQLGPSFNTEFAFQNGLAGVGHRLFYYKKHLLNLITRSDDNGSHWDTPSSATIKSGIRDLLVLSDCVLACTTLEGLLKSTDEGKTFKPAMKGMYASIVGCIGKSCKSRLWVQTDDGTYYSDDRGGTWASKDHVYYFPYLTEDRIFRMDSCAYQYSENNGQNWTTIGADQLPGCFYMATSDHAALFYNRHQIYRLKDGETTVEPFGTSPLPNFEMTSVRVASGLLRCEVVTDTSISEYATTLDQSNWIKIPPTNMDYPGLAFQEENYIFQSINGVYHIWHVGDNNWQKFYPINVSTGDTIRMSQIHFMKTGGGYRWIGGYYQGLFYSNVDDPYHWYPFDPAVPYPILESIFFDQNEIWVGTFGANIYAYNYAPATVSGQLSAADFTLFPNPGITTATLRFSRAFSDALSLKIFNAAGVLVYEAELSPGKQWTPDLTILHAGLYFWQIKNSTGTVLFKWVKGGR